MNWSFIATGLREDVILQLMYTDSIPHYTKNCIRQLIYLFNPNISILVNTSGDLENEIGSLIISMKSFLPEKEPEKET